MEKKSDDGLLSSGIIFLIGTFSVAILNYLYQVFMGRMLGPMDYGILGSLFAIIYLATFSSQTFNRVISKYSAEFKGRNQEGYLKRLIKRGFYKISLCGFIALILYIMLTPWIADFMNLDSRTGLMLAGIISYILIVGAVFIGALNGLQMFVWQNLAGFISAVVKLGLAIVLVYLGFGVNGALIAVAVSGAFILIVGAYPLKRKLNGIKDEKFDTKEVYKYAVPVFLAALLPLLLITLDQVLVKHFFSNADAGFYAAAGNIAKIIWFGSGFLVSAMFPKIVSLRAQGKSTGSLLNKGLIYTSFLVLIGVGVFLATPRAIVLVMYGSEYVSITSLIGMFGLVLGLFSINQVLIAYNLAVEKYKFIWIIFIGFLLEIIGIGIFHTGLSDIVKISLLAQSFILIGMLVYNRREIFNGE